MLDLQRDGDVRILRFDNGENRFSPEFLIAAGKALDELESAPAPIALVTTGTGKFYSNGLDLDWAAGNQDQFPAYLASVHHLFARMIALPMPTIAAINGHAFAAGAMLALCHDFTVMRADRGYFCLPEIDLGFPFTPGMSALIASRLTPNVAHEAMLTGRRYGGTDAAAAGIVTRAAAEDRVLPEAITLAAPLAAKSGATIGKIRAELYRDVLAALES